MEKDPTCASSAAATCSVPTTDVANVCQPVGNPQNGVRITRCKNNSFEGLAFSLLEVWAFDKNWQQWAWCWERREEFFHLYFQTFFVHGTSAKVELKQKVGTT